MTPSKPTSIGASSSVSELIGSSTDQTPMINAETTSNGFGSSQPSNREAGDIKYLYDKMRKLESIKNMEFMDRMMLSDIIWEAWYCGFNDREIITNR